ncbi:DUF5108 domain-containing protein [Bacteroides sp. 224]|uniref:DUF5108 domain-containing protein n=1 Tax=Bacteroides sp. 224 TaxID=2302936 RepID=UPI0013D83611|nr:DUF5108 domain-containing protein [Bacteroides sp. 224]NDV63653.1 DUF5108 domain-containing protein [Bacteroides sp. 224]
MKNIVRFCLLILFVAFYSCDDPYKDTVFKVYDLQPAATYLQGRSDDFSEWVKVLKYGDLFNAINRADDSFTVLAPTNEAVYSFLKKKGVSSIEELDREYARTLVQYHIINDSIDKEDFVRGGELPARTLSGDALLVTFDENTSGEVYVNKEAHVSEFAIRAINGRIYVLDDVLSPAVQTIYERLSESGDYKIFCEALDKTGWKDSLNVTTSVFYGPYGMQVELRKHFTVFAVSDEIFAKDGITSFNGLAQKVGASSDEYEALSNELNHYVAYHILDGAHKLAAFQAFDGLSTNQKLWYTRSGVDMILASEDGLNDGVKFDEENSDILVKNGIIQPIDGYLPVKQQEPVPFVFDFCNYSELGSYINTKGKGQLFQQLSRVDKGQSTALTKFIGRKEIVPQVSCYQLEVGPNGTRATTWNYLEYATVGSEGGVWGEQMNNDHLVVNIGYNGALTVNTPPIIAGKYKVTLFYAYDPQQKFMGERAEDSAAGLTQFSFDGSSGAKSTAKRVYDAKSDGRGKGDAKDYLSIELFVEPANDADGNKLLEFTETETHTLKMVVQDPAASSHTQFRMYFDYLLFEPVIE